MAKELPYFKFEPAEFLTRDISFCSMVAQGLFINICSLYWHRKCVLNKDQVLRKFNYENEFNELVSEGIIDLNNDTEISIKFLDAQYNEAINKSLTNSLNGKNGGRPKANINRKETEIKANVNQNESELKGIRLDKIRGDEIIQDKIIKDKITKNTYFEFVGYDNEQLQAKWKDFQNHVIEKGGKITYQQNEAMQRFICDRYKQTDIMIKAIDITIANGWKSFSHEYSPTYDYVKNTLTANKRKSLQ